MTRVVLLLILVLGTFLVSSDAQEPFLFPVEKEGKAGYIDTSGKVVIPLRFDEARQFSEGLASVRVGEDWGYIDSRGDFVIKPRFFEAGLFTDGRARVGIYWRGRKIIHSKVGEYGYVDRVGRILKSQTPSSSKLFYGRKLFQTSGNMPDSRTGYFDETGKVAIRPTFLSGKEFSEGLACVYDGQRAGFIGTNGNTEIAFKFDACGSFSEGLASIIVNGLIGFIDKTGKIVIQPQFLPVIGAESRFSNGVAVMQIGESERPPKDGLRDVIITAERNIHAAESGIFGVIDKTGQFIIPPRYVQIGNFHDGLAWVNLGDAYIIHGDTDRWGYINKQGKIIWKSF